MASKKSATKAKVGSKKAKAPKALTKRRSSSKALAVKGADSTTFFWNVKKYPQVLKDIEVAKGVYDIHVKRGFKVFHLDVAGNKGNPMKEFDASAGGMLFFKAPSGRYAQIANGD